MKKKPTIIELVSFTRAENRGIVFLIGLLVSVSILRYVDKQRNQSSHLQFVEYTSVNELAEREIAFGNQNARDNKKIQTGFTEIQPERFDPNKVSRSKLIGFGLSESIATRIIRYREAGGKFTKPSDLYKIYGIDSAQVKILLDYVKIRENPDDLFHGKRMSGNPLHKIEINGADTSQLLVLTGENHLLAGRILKYRDWLGGFYSSEQIREVYGIDDKTYTMISDYLVADTTLVRRINLNTVTFDELSKHPYLSRYEARAILGYRRIMGKISSENELVKNYILSENTFERARHYFKID
jgi:DNA uptake protein ComE-like DNA-binding protein